MRQAIKKPRQAVHEKSPEVGIEGHAEEQDGAESDDTEAPKNHGMHDPGFGITFQNLGLGEGDRHQIFETGLIVVEPVVGLSRLDDLPPTEDGKAEDG